MKAYFDKYGHLTIEAENTTEAVALNAWTHYAADSNETVRDLLEGRTLGLRTSFSSDNNPNYQGVRIFIEERR